MGDIGNKDSADYTRIVGADENYAADVSQLEGENRLLTQSNAVVEDLLSIDQKPDSFFTINNTGAQGDEITISIAGTNSDPSSPDDDLPSYSKTFTIQSSEEGDEFTLVDRIRTELNNDSGFFTDAALEVVEILNRPIIHIRSRRFSLDGEFYERPNAGDFSVTTTGSASVTVNSDKLVSRGKNTSVIADPNSPHKLGALNISGTVATEGKSVANFEPQYLTDSNGNSSLTVDGSTTNKVFSVNALSVDDLNISSVSILAQDGNIELKNRFMDQTINNGFLLDIVSDNGKASDFPVFMETADFINLFASKTVFQSTKILDLRFKPPNPFVLRAGTNDKVEFTIRDDLSNIVYFKISVEAFRV